MRVCTCLCVRQIPQCRKLCTKCCGACTESVNCALAKDHPKQTPYHPPQLNFSFSEMPFTSSSYVSSPERLCEFRVDQTRIRWHRRGRQPRAQALRRFANLARCGSVVHHYIIGAGPHSHYIIVHCKTCKLLHHIVPEGHSWPLRPQFSSQ